jgi:hypothetical protein
MKDTRQKSRRDFLKTTTAGATGIMLGGASIKSASASSGGSWVDGMQINPAIDNLRVVCAHDPAMVVSGWGVNAPIYANMDKMAMALAQKATPDEAWATIFQKPAGKAWADVKVAMKASYAVVQCPYKIIEELHKLGVPYANFMYFDCNTSGVNCGGAKADGSPTWPLQPGVKGSGPAKGSQDFMHGLKLAPVPYKGAMVNMNCAADLVDNIYDIFITTGNDRDHGDAVGGATLTCKSLYGVYNAIDSMPYLHGAIGQTPDGITGMLSLIKSSAILGPNPPFSAANPPRMQLSILDSGAASGRLLMGTLAPLVDYLCITKIRGPIEGKVFNANVVKRFYQDFGYTDTQLANVDLVDALTWKPGQTGAGPSLRRQESLRLQFIVSAPSFKLSMLDLDLPLCETIPMAVSILDSRGRVVRELTPKKESGMMVVWDGRAQSGMHVPAGMYVVKVINGNISKSGSVLLVPR